MKKNLLKAIRITGLFSIISINLITSSQAQVDGDLRSRSNNAGWGTAATFQKYEAATGNWNTSDVVPTNTTNVTLRDGFTHTTNGTGYTAGTLNIGEGNAFRGTAVLTGDALTGITIVNAGKLNSLSSNIGIYGTGTTQATATIGSVKIIEFSLNSKGTGYTTATVNVGAIWAPATAYVVNNQVNSGGNLYTCTTAGTSDATTGPSGNGATITDGTAVWKYAGAVATATATISGGGVTAVNLTNAGSGYISIPSVSIVGDGTLASYTTLVGIETINITNGGAGYTTPPQITLGTIFQVGNAGTNRSVTVAGNVAFKSGANIVSGGGSGSNQTLIIGGDLSAVTPISFRSNHLTLVGNTNVTFNKAGIATLSGANMVFNNVTIATGTTLTITNNVTILGTLTNNGTLVGTYSTTLPITLTNFTAKADLNSVKVSWTTSSEIDNDKFVVEKSVDGKNYSKVAEVKAKGASTYSIVDNSPSNGTSYYRLVQVDLNGKSKTYDPTAVNFSLKSESSLVAFPNPTLGNISFNAIGSTGNLQVSLSNITGNVVHKETVLNTGASSYSLNLNQKLAPGKYILQVKGSGFDKTTVVIVL